MPNWEGDFQISMQGRVLADLAFQAICMPPRNGEPYAVVRERTEGGRVALIRCGGDFFDRISGKAGDFFTLKACVDLLHGFEAAHCKGPALLGSSDGMADIAMRRDAMDFDSMTRLDDWVRSCRRGERVFFAMREGRMEDAEDVARRREFGESWKRIAGDQAVFMEFPGSQRVSSQEKFALAARKD